MRGRGGEGAKEVSIKISPSPTLPLRLPTLEPIMNLLTKLKHSILGRPQPRVTQLAPPDASGMRIDELPPFSLKTADLMRFDPQVRIGLGARNGLLMAAEVAVSGEER